MILTYELALRFAIPFGVVTAFAARHFGVMSPSRLELLYGAVMFVGFVAFVLVSRIKKKKKALGFDLAGQPYESEGYDLSSAPRALRMVVQGCITTCYFLFWWLVTEGILRLYVDH